MSESTNPRIRPNGTKVWYKDGKRHRVDGPAVEYANGAKIWYVDGKRHRVDGPAAVYADGDKEWCKDGKFHRLDGPAIVHADGDKWWYIDDIEVGEEGVNRYNAIRAAIREII